MGRPGRMGACVVTWKFPDAFVSFANALSCESRVRRSENHFNPPRDDYGNYRALELLFDGLQYRVSPECGIRDVSRSTGTSVSVVQRNCRIVI